MILAGKIDVFTDGSTNSINVCRECVRPNTKIHLSLTLDHSILQHRITRNILLQSIADYSSYYQDVYLQNFMLPIDDSNESYQNCLFLGSGAGFFSKTIMYRYYGKEQGLEKTASYMKEKFPRGRHEQDKRIGISPHTIKYTKYGGILYPFGLCSMEIL